MVYDGRWKMVHFEGGLRPMLFDLGSDPEELFDVAEDPANAEHLDRLYGYLAVWGRRQSQRVTVSAGDIEAMRGRSGRRGIVLGAYDADDVDAEVISKYVGPAEADYTKP